MRTAQLSTLLFAFWLVLTSSMAPSELLVGLAVSISIAVVAVRLLWDGAQSPPMTASEAGRFVLYVPRLIKDIVVAAVYVAKKVLDPKLPIAPTIVPYDVPLDRTLSRVALANSITLTPGTLTIDLEGNVLTVHCLDEELAESLLGGELQRRVGHVFERK